MYLDWTYIVLVLPAVLFAMWASAKVNRTFEKYKNSYNSRQITGAQAARWVLVLIIMHMIMEKMLFLILLNI